MRFDNREVKTSSNSIGHVLLISPLTFSYHLNISATLQAMGYEVTWWDERASSATWYKIALRLCPALAARLSEKKFFTKLERINQCNISHVLVIKGEGLSQRVVKAIRNTFPGASVGLYLWDGVENVGGVFRILGEFDSIATFDPMDAETNGWFYRPLFGRNISPHKEKLSSVKYDWSFIGTIHSDRHRVIHRLRGRYDVKYRYFIFCYFQSPFILFIRKIFDWTLWRAPKGTLSTQSMIATEVAEIVDCSKAVLDVEHPRQRGFTMRTIETLLAGKKLITTNKHIFNSDLHDATRVCVIDRNNPEISDVFLDKVFLPISDELRMRYSCEGWASELLQLQDEAKREKN